MIYYTKSQTNLNTEAKYAKILQAKQFLVLPFLTTSFCISRELEYPAAAGNRSVLPAAVGYRSVLPAAAGNRSVLPAVVGYRSVLPAAVGNRSVLPAAVGNRSVLPTAMINWLVTYGTNPAYWLDNLQWGIIYVLILQDLVATIVKLSYIAGSYWYFYCPQRSKIIK